MLAQVTVLATTLEPGQTGGPCRHAVSVLTASGATSAMGAEHHKECRHIVSKMSGNYVAVTRKMLDP
jgi:hypothetical protein